LIVDRSICLFIYSVYYLQFIYLIYLFIVTFSFFHYLFVLADRTIGRAYATLLRLSSVDVCDVMYCG